MTQNKDKKEPAEMSKLTIGQLAEELKDTGKVQLFENMIILDSLASPKIKGSLGQNISFVNSTFMSPVVIHVNRGMLHLQHVVFRKGVRFVFYAAHLIADNVQIRSASCEIIIKHDSDIEILSSHAREIKISGTVNSLIVNNVGIDHLLDLRGLLINDKTIIDFSGSLIGKTLTGKIDEAIYHSQQRGAAIHLG